MRGMMAVSKIAVTGPRSHGLHRTFTSAIVRGDFQAITFEQMIDALENSTAEAKQEFQEFKDRMLREGKITPERMAEFEQRIAGIFAAKDEMVEDMFLAIKPVPINFDGAGYEFAIKNAAVQREAAARANDINQKVTKMLSDVEREVDAMFSGIDQEVAAMLSDIDRETAELTAHGWGDVSGRRWP